MIIKSETTFKEQSCSHLIWSKWGLKSTLFDSFSLQYTIKLQFKRKKKKKTQKRTEAYLLTPLIYTVALAVAAAGEPGSDEDEALSFLCLPVALM